MALAIALNLVAAIGLLVILAAMMRVPFRIRRSPAASPAQLRAWRAWLDPRPASGRVARRTGEPRIAARAQEAPGRA